MLCYESVTESRVALEAERDLERVDDGLEHHTADICLACYKPRQSLQAAQSDDGLLRIFNSEASCTVVFTCYSPFYWG